MGTPTAVLPYDPFTLAGGQAASLPFYNAIEYGSIGTGVDSAVAINAAIDEASANGGGVVLLPAGTIDVATPIAVKRYVSIIGAGLHATSLRAQDAIKVMQFSTTGNEFDMVLSDFEINLNSLATYGIDSIDTGGAGKNTWFASRIRMIGFPASSVGIRTGSWGISLDKIVMTNSGSAGTIGIDANNSSQSGSNALRVRDCGIAGMLTAGIRVAGSNTALATSGVNLVDNYIDACTIGVLVTSSGTGVVTGTRINGNRFEGCSSYSVDVVGESTFTMIRDNEITGATGVTPYLIRIAAADCTVKDNTFAAYTTAAVQLVFNARRTHVADNTRTGSVAFIEDNNTTATLTQVEPRTSGLVSMKRYQTSEDTAYTVASDFTLSAGWGATASVTAGAATDQRGQITVTSAGAGAAASPTIGVTFKTAWAATPVIVVSRAGGSQPTVPVSVTARSTTGFTITFNGTPVAGETYSIAWIVMG